MQSKVSKVDVSATRVWRGRLASGDCVAISQYRCHISGVPWVTASVRRPKGGSGLAPYKAVTAVVWTFQNLHALPLYMVHIFIYGTFIMMISFNAFWVARTGVTIFTKVHDCQESVVNANTMTKLHGGQKIGEGTFHSVPPDPKIWGGTCLRASMASPPMPECFCAVRGEGE